MVSASLRPVEDGLGPPGDAHRWLRREELGRLVDLLRLDGRAVIGPTVDDGTIVHREIMSAGELPFGIRDEQSPARYRTHAAEGPGHTFDFASAPTSWKRWTFPSTVELGTGRRDGTAVTFEPPVREIRPLAFLGARACDLAALRIHDRVLRDGLVADDDYVARRADIVTIGVDCATPSSTCFCASMGTGPEVTTGFDLALTELDDGFVVRAGTDTGRSIVARLDLPLADQGSLAAANEVPVQARAAMTRSIDINGLPARLIGRPDHPRWAEVAERCLACTSCTLVCPTCFCTSVTQVSDLDGTTSTSNRQWDSCFTLGFASVAGGNYRSRRKDRYRQWLTHKFGTWVQQFGTMGCVGCGRCITWCPVGIDIRDELDAIAAPLPVIERPSVPFEAPIAAASPGLFAPVTILAVEHETPDTVTFTLGDVPDAILAGQPGQFVMMELPGYSAVPICISRLRPDHVQVTVRAAGPATSVIVALQPGAQVGLRGPLGRGWPLGIADGRDVLIVARGLGLPPLRSLIERILEERDRYRNVRIAISARRPDDFVMRADTALWRARDDIAVEVTVDRAGPGWEWPVGVVTQLIDRAPIDPIHTVAYLCGRERMMHAASRILGARGVLPDRIFVSMERHMQCGVGLCGHCQMGRFFVCKDGPVFSRAELGDTFELEGI